MDRTVTPSARSAGTLFRQALLSCIRWLVLLGLLGAAGSVLAQNGRRDFDHTRTGFPLTGVHVNERCESCHMNGILKGTPRDCASCHTAGSRFSRGNIVKTTSHMPTAQACETCHNTITFANTHFSHAGVKAGTCADCHNGRAATGKGPNHPMVSSSCDTCHRTTAFRPPTRYDHVGVVIGSCDKCHNGTGATGKNQTTHIPTNAACDNCHRVTTAWSPAVYSHAGVVAGSCGSCHTGTYQKATGKSASNYHTATTSIPCDTCHKSTAGWTTTSFGHVGLAAGSCVSCHVGARAKVKGTAAKPGHLVTTAACDSCHKSTAAWLPVTAFNHVGVAVGSCGTCHDGTSAKGKTAVTHIPTSAACDSCHKITTAWIPATYGHVGVVAGSCGTCHTGTYQKATGKSATTHIPTSAACDSCHKITTAWSPATYGHVGVVAGSCGSCHTGTYQKATGKSATNFHTVSTAACDTCHKSTAVWTTTSFSHTGVAAGSCVSCHVGARAKVKGTAAKPGHLVTTAACDSCHKQTTAWLPVSSFNHVGVVAGSCGTCHNGTSATGKSATTHIPTSAACDSCHKITTAWRPATYGHVGVVAGSCGSCHTGTYQKATGKSATNFHTVSTAACDTCHKSTAVWTTTSFSHTGVAAGSCVSCHVGARAKVKGTAAKPGHLVTTAACDSCHKQTTAWLPVSSFNHVGVVAGSCGTCHNGTSATGKSATTHIPTSAACDSCHKITTAWSPATYGHVGVVAGSCGSCHTGTYQKATGKSATNFHTVSTAACDTCHKSTAVWTTTSFSHTGVAAGSCVSCHVGARAKVKGTAAKPGHLVTTAACDSCHKQTTAWLPVSSFNHVGVVAGSCGTCHNGTSATGKSATTHIPTSAACDSCHKITTAWRPATYGHVGVVAGSCGSCHTGTYQKATGKSATNFHTVSTAACDTCHKSTAVWTTTSFSHTGVAAGSCVSCHVGARAKVKGTAAKPGHLVTTAACDSCHKQTTAWLPVSSFNHVGVVAGSCGTCHNGTSATGKSATTHIPTSAACDSCHKITTAWRPATYGHVGVVAGSCGSCHTGTYQKATGKSATNFHTVSTAACDTCHKSTAVWTTTSFSHTGVAAGSCVSCHVGARAKVKGTAAKPGHLVTTAACDSCHKQTTAWLPVSSFNHVGVVAGSCGTCHNGTSATGKSATTHIPTSAACDSCHKITTAWRPGHLRSRRRGGGQLRQLPHRHVSEGDRQERDQLPHREHRGVRHLPQVDRGVDHDQLQPHRCGGRQLRQLPRWGARQGQRHGRQARSPGDHGRVRQLPQADHGLAAGELVQSRRRGGRQLRHLPQRHQCDRQERDHAYPDQCGVRQLPQDHHRLASGHLRSRRRGGGQLRQLPHRHVSEGDRQERDQLPHREHRGVRHLPQVDRGVDHDQLQPHRCGGRQLRQLPRWGARQGQRHGRQARSPGDHGRVRQLPQADHGLAAGELVQSRRRGGRQLRHLPQRHQCDRQERDHAYPDQCGVRQLPQDHHRLASRPPTVTSAWWRAAAAAATPARIRRRPARARPTSTP